MNISVEYFAQARVAAGVATEVLSIPEPATLHDVLTALARRHGAKLAALLLPGGQPSRTVIFAIGDRQIPPGDNVTLRDGDHLLIVPPISGGRS